MYGNFDFVIVELSATRSKNNKQVHLQLLSINKHCLLKIENKGNFNMKRLILFCSALLMLLLAACAAQPSSEQAAATTDKPVVTVYRAPT